MTTAINRLIIFCLTLFLSVTVYAQRISGRVVDAEDNKALPFASVSVAQTSKGTISNQEGYFSLYLSKEDSVLAFSFIGYKTKFVSTSTLSSSPTIKLEKAEVALDQFVVHAEKDYIRDLIMKVQRNLKQSEPIDSKAYMKVQSDEQNNPIELIECYYNAVSNLSGVLNLTLKNGRAGIYKDDGQSYHSMSSSKFVEEFNIANKRDYMPFNPFQLRKGELNRFYEFKQLASIGDSLTQISFESIADENNFFSGDCWIDLKSHQLKQINLHVENASYFALKPIWGGDKLENLNATASISFESYGRNTYLNHIEFTYDFDYVHEKNTSFDISAPDTVRKIKGSGVLYLFDYNQKFIIPSYSYDPRISDYNQIALASVNGDFWKLNHGLPSTKIEKQKLAYFGQKGLLLNHFTQNNEMQRHMDSTLHTVASILWRDSIRINLLFDINIDTLPKHVHQLILHQTYYHLEVQLYMDINETSDSIQYFTATVMDGIRTYYILPKEDYSNAFVNIYFDICEIERRKLEERIKNGPITVKRLKQLYGEAMVNLQDITQEYLREVDRGREYNKLMYWNEYVDKELGINNFEFFEMKTR